MDIAPINAGGGDVPEGVILIVPQIKSGDCYWQEILEPLAGSIKRDWFTSHFYYCLPLVIGNQYGFIIKSTRDLTISWPGGDEPVSIVFNDIDENNIREPEKQAFKNLFRSGILTIQNRFAFKTAPGINLMTIQPPNFFIPGVVAMTGVVETDNIRRDFTFNLKVTVPNMAITIRRGDPVGAFIPVPRNFVETHELKHILDIFSNEQLQIELNETYALSQERQTVDLEKPHYAGRRYFNGVHTTGEKYTNHQNRPLGK